MAESNDFLDTITGFLKGIWNPDAYSTRRQAREAQEASIAALERAAKTDTSLKGALESEGLIGPDGKINREKYFDSDLMRNAFSRSMEATDKALANARAAASQRAMVSAGRPGADLTDLFNMANVTNEAARRGARELTGTEAGLRQQAGEQALMFGRDKQSETVNMENRNVNLANARAQAALQRASQEQLGMLQTPEGWMRAASIFTGMGGPEAVAGLVQGAGDAINNAAADAGLFGATRIARPTPGRNDAFTGYGSTPVMYSGGNTMYQGSSGSMPGYDQDYNDTELMRQEQEWADKYGEDGFKPIPMVPQQRLESSTLPPGVNFYLNR